VIRRLLQPYRPNPLALALLALAALGVLVAGFQHGRLFHRGYAQVEIVGLLFIMNALGSTVVVLLLVVRQIWAFVLGTLSICAPSLVSIALSHSSMGFLGFREGGYDPDALVIVVAELGAVVFALLGAVVALSDKPAEASRLSPVRGVLIVLVALVMGCAATGIGTGEAQAERQAAPSPAQVAAARQRIAAGGATTRRGRELFASEGCDRCHAIAAIGADGKLGPRLDTIENKADDIAESIVDPRHDIADGYPEKLMPDYYGKRLSNSQVQALADFIAAVTSGEDGSRDDNGGGDDNGGEDSSGKGSGRSGED
jgi:mono/diheme cytochrome c family protein